MSAADPTAGHPEPYAPPWTPGQWKVVRESDKRSGWRGVSIVAGHMNLASIVGQLDDREGANARLMAAAPSLAIALRELFHASRSRVEFPNSRAARSYFDDARRMAEAALAKADAL